MNHRKYINKKRRGVYIGWNNYKLFVNKKSPFFIKESNLRSFHLFEIRNPQIRLHSGKSFIKLRYPASFFFNKLNLLRQTKVGGFKIHQKKKKK